MVTYWITLAFLQGLRSNGVMAQGSSNLTVFGPTLDYTSCRARCEESYFPGRPCYCNPSCQQYENCCDDFYAECRPEYVWTEEWSNFDGHAYKFFSDLQVTRPVAVSGCRREGGLLVSINSAEEQKFIAESVLKQRVLSAFIGGSDIATEGRWVWADGTVMAGGVNFWYPGQPDDKDKSEDCAIITNYMFWAVRKRQLDDFFWLDYNCAINNRLIQGYVCEKTLKCEPNPCLNGGSCYYVGAAEDYRCECLPGFYGLQCEVQLKEGDIWSACGETNLTANSGEVTSPLFPRDYPPNVRCQWIINVGVGNTISISIKAMDLEISKDCFFDSLTIMDGHAEGGTPLIGPICGDSLTSNDTSLTLPRTTSGPLAVIDFRTDGTQTGRGFQLSYKADRCGRGEGQSGCSVPRLFETVCGRTEVTQGPPSGDKPCMWEIRVPMSKVINLTFTDFNIFDSGQDCKGGSLMVYDGSINSDTVIDVACGRRFPWSLVSMSNVLHLRLNGTIWDTGTHKLAFQYTSYNNSRWRSLTHITTIDVGQNEVGEFSTSESPINVETENTKIYMWLVRCAIGDRLHLNWTLSSQEKSTYQIFDGHSTHSKLLEEENSAGIAEKTGQVTATTFQLLIKLTANITDNSIQFKCTYRAEEWLPALSGCYRPWYSSSIDSLSTENSVVLPDQPVVVMISESAYHATDPGYNHGSYCKWIVRAEPSERLKLAFSDFNVPPNLPGCHSDGFVVYDPAANLTKAKLCGESPRIIQDMYVSTSNVLELYFYSDTRGKYRSDGIVRALITVAEPTGCDFNQMETSKNPTIQSTCGILFSPWFPGMVPPDLTWTWTLEGNGTGYFIVNVHYVVGPGLQGDCGQFFQVREVPADSAQLKQFEANLMTVCQDTKLFIPSAALKNPPGQKLAIELNTLSTQIYQRWEFKISYSLATLEKPKYTEAPPGSCPEKYYYYRGYCYLYEEWVRRHYELDVYKHQTTWQASYDRCKGDGGTLLTLKDEEEANFIKYQLATAWLWDPAAPTQLNHRTIYLGLSNQRGEYEWNDGVQLAYSDWYQPKERWAQPIVHEDEPDKYDILGLNNPEPKNDRGSVCTAMLVVNPFSSLNWVKLPCDYPIFRAGVICKKPAIGIQEASAGNILHNATLVDLQSNGYLACKPGWGILGNSCIRLMTYYSKVIASVNSEETNQAPPVGLTYTEASGMCNLDQGLVGQIEISDIDVLKVHLNLWRHGLAMGGIWLREAHGVCKVLQVYKVHRLSEDTHYKIVEGNCDHLLTETRPYSVLCSMEPTRQREECLSTEFQCENGVCIAIDFVCDGSNDCNDNSDEKHCQTATSCGMNKFRCDNGDCISMALFCDSHSNCADGSDEKSCESCGPDEFKCGSRECIHHNKTCDFRKDCRDGSDEREKVCEGQCRGFQCFSGLCLPNTMQHDVISDCPGVAQEDERLISRRLGSFRDLEDDSTMALDVENGVYSGCPSPDQAQCMPNYDRCFTRSNTCVYDTSIADEGRGTRVQATCREGSHLRVACERVECPGMFRCPSAYCVPYSKVCDGRKDCPRGEDEVGCDDYTCPGLFHCKKESFCIPHNKVCNGQTDCPKYGEDEKYCGEIDVLCQETCQCDGNVAFCSNITTLPIPLDEKVRSLRSIIIVDSYLVITNDSFTNLHWLGKLGLSHNHISILPPYCFRDLANLFHLDLSGNGITFLDPLVFSGMKSLRTLNLNNNQLDLIDIWTFSELPVLSHLIITKNPLTEVTQDAFDKVNTLKILNSDAYKFCCIANVETCTPEPDEFSSCRDLMANFPLQISIWVLGIFAFAGNIFVIIWRVMKDRSKVSSFLIINLGCSDFFMGIYMLIIASVDTYYRGVYIVYADKWRASTLCQIAGIMAMLSSEVSVFMLTIITADRLFVIFYPFKSKLRLSQARYLVFGTWAACFIMSIIPALGIPYFGDSFFGTTGVCLPFQMNNEQRPGWEYSVFVFLVLNLCSFIFIAIAYILIYYKVKKEADKMGGKASSTTDDVSLAKKLMLIVATDLSCWVPIILIGFVGLGGVKIPAEVSAWIAVFVLPLNSAVNPILYTMSAIDCGRKKKTPVSQSTTNATRISATSLPVANDRPGQNNTTKAECAGKTKPSGNVAVANTA